MIENLPKAITPQVTHLKDPDMFWDFISLMPMTTHQVSFLFSDRGTPNGYRFMNGYGVEFSNGDIDISEH